MPRAAQMGQLVIDHPFQPQEHDDANSDSGSTESTRTRGQRSGSGEMVARVIDELRQELKEWKWSAVRHGDTIHKVETVLRTITPRESAMNMYIAIGEALRIIDEDLK